MPSPPHNEFLEYALAMAFADGLLDPVKQFRYIGILRRRLGELDIEAEHELIVSHTSELRTADRRRITALVEYVRDKERLGPTVKNLGNEGRL